MSNFLSIITMIATIVTPVLYWLLYNVAQRQVDVTVSASKEQVENSKLASKMQTYFQVSSKLSLDRELRADKKLLDMHQPGDPWSDEEHEAAFRVCAALNVAAVLAYEDALPKALFIREYGDVMRKTAKQAEAVVPKGHYPAFERLREEAQDLTRLPAKRIDNER